MATYAIGDIQGCFRSLENLLNVCAFNPENDKIWFAGDLVNRGPRSLETLRFVKNLGGKAISVLGNHDLTLLIIAEGFRKPSKGDTLDAILNAPDREELLDWLRNLPLCHHEKINENTFFLVHAGLLPAWTIAQSKNLAEEVTRKLRGKKWREFLQHLWGNSPNYWDENHSKSERCRVIVNAMTRMRFCTPNGQMEFESKGEIKNAPEGFLPWFEINNRQSADATILAGHWSALGLHVNDNFIALDTGCLWGGKLTALRLEDRAIFQVPCATDEIWQGK